MQNLHIAHRARRKGAKMKTLIGIQESALAEMAESRSSEKRAAKHRSAVLRSYRLAALDLGYTEAEITQQCYDLGDMFRLRRDADE